LACRILTIIDGYSRERMAPPVERRFGSRDVLMTLARLLIERGMPDYIRSDDGAEPTTKALRSWLQRLGVKTLFIKPGSPWENGYNESFNGKLRDELLDREIFHALWEAKVLAERRRKEYNRVRPHSSPGYRPPAPETVQLPPMDQAV
jgi:transposase InsO family protein